MVHLLGRWHSTTGGQGSLIHSATTITHSIAPHPPLFSLHDGAQYCSPVAEYT